jgi:hypothetical protein
LTLLNGRPSSSAAIWARLVRLPEISVRPILTVIRDSGAGRLSMSTSSLIISILTGRPAFIASRAHKGARG